MSVRESQTYTLRRMTNQDLGMVLSWRNSKVVRRYMFNRHEIQPDEHEKWFASASRDETKVLLLFECNGLPQGFMGFNNVVKSGVAEWGFYLAPEAGHGMGHNLGRVALNFAFNELNLHKVYGNVIADNGRSIRFHNRLGFLQEGILREHYFDGDCHRDVVCFGMLCNEWNPKDQGSLLK